MTLRSLVVAAGVGGGVLVIFATSPGPVVTWLGLALLGGLAGASAGRTSGVGVVLAAVVVASIAAWVIGTPGAARVFWWLGVVVALLLVGGGFIVGTSVGWSRDPGARAAAAWRSMRWRRRLAIAGCAALAIVALTVYTGYTAAVGSTTFIEARADWMDCRTPLQRYGWAYEAINYDRSSDESLMPYEARDENGVLRWTCPEPGAPAGDLVRSTDGIRLAGWYIPAGTDPDPGGPTVVVVPGWKANKSDILKYAAVFHPDRNVVLMDVRNVGQSSAAETTLGLREQDDVRAMLDWLVATKGPTEIALVGDSMGGATALAAAVADPRVDALILDSMHANIVVAIGNIAEAENGHPSIPASWAIVAATSMRLGEDVTSIDPVGMITRLGDRPVLLTHGTADQVDPPAESVERNLHAAMAAGVDVGLHYCQGARHGATLETCPEAWARWATSFLDGTRDR